MKKNYGFRYSIAFFIKKKGIIMIVCWHDHHCYTIIRSSKEKFYFSKFNCYRREHPFKIDRSTMRLKSHSTKTIWLCIGWLNYNNILKSILCIRKLLLDKKGWLGVQHRRHQIPKTVISQKLRGFKDWNLVCRYIT